MPADIDEIRLIELVNKEYDLEIGALKLGPQGEDSYSYAGNSVLGKRYFIRLQKTQSTSSLETSMRATLALRQKTGLRQVVAPHLTRRRRTVCRFGAYHVCVFPFIEGRRLYDIGLSGKDVAKAARLIAKVHTTDTRNWFPRLRRERFDNPFEENTRRILRDVKRPRQGYTNKYQRNVSRLVKAEQATIILALKEMRRLRSRTRRLHREQVLSHGDANAASFIKDGYGRLFLTDWGDIGLGPAERDLFHFSGRSLGLFLKEYFRVRANVKLSTEIFAFYFYRWVLQEISDYCSRILYLDTRSREKQHAWRELQDYVPVQHDLISRDLRRIGELLDSLPFSIAAQRPEWDP
jgi:hypothetical protein